MTGKLLFESRDGSTNLPHGLTFGAAQKYQLLPAALSEVNLRNSTPYWRIELINLNNNPPLGIDLIGDVIIGRGETVDVDLNLYSGYLEGVSRRHLMLRATVEGLYIIDLGSTNGSYLNGIALTLNKSTLMNNGDVVTLGNLSFELKLIDHSTLGQLRTQLLVHIREQTKAQPDDRKGREPIPIDDPETIMMHFRKMLQHPQSLSQWMHQNYALTFKDFQEKDLT